jgi:hypothetical protein
MSASAECDSDPDEAPPPLPPVAAPRAKASPPKRSTASSAYSIVTNLLHHIGRPELLLNFQNEEVSDELLPYADCESLVSLGLTQEQARAAIKFMASGCPAPVPAAAHHVHSAVDDAGVLPSTGASSRASAPEPDHERPSAPTAALAADKPFCADALVHDSNPVALPISAPATARTAPPPPPPARAPAPATFSGHSTAAIERFAVMVQNSCRCRAARCALALQVSLYDRLLASTAGISAHSQKCLGALGRLARLQCKCESHSMGLAAHLDMSLKSSSGFLADVSFPALFGNLQQLTCAWKAVEVKMASSAPLSSLAALLKWWRALHDGSDGPSLSHVMLHALQLSAAHTSSLIMGGGVLWAWLLKTRPAAQSFLSLALRTLAAGDVEYDIYSMITSPIHAMADVCDQLMLLCDIDAIDFNFVVCTSSILRAVQSQLEVLLSHPPSFNVLSILKLSWVQVCKLSFISPIPPPPGLLCSPPLPSAVTTASFVPDCFAVMAAIDTHIRLVFPCWPWVLNIPAADATLDIDFNSNNESASSALLSLAGVGSLHLMFNSRVLEKSWSDLINRDSLPRASAHLTEDGDWRISCRITDTEQRSDLIREYTSYVIRVRHRRLDWVVSRRFSDFELLVKQLQQELPAWAFNQLLQLPSAKTFGQSLNKNSIAVIEMRRLQLELYLADLCARRAACQSSSLRKFLDFQSRLQETDEHKSNASIDSSAATSPRPSSASPSLRGVAAAVMASFSSRKTAIAPKSSNTQSPDSSEAADHHADSPGVSRTTSHRREAPDHGKPVVVEPVMYGVLYKRGGFHNTGFLRKSSWKNKAVAIWPGLLAYWPAVEEDKTKLEPLSQLGTPTSVVNLAGARISNFAERPNSFDIHVSGGVITFTAHSSEAFAAWLSCLVSCIVPSSESFSPPNIQVLLGLTSAPSSPRTEPAVAPSGDAPASVVDFPKESAASPPNSRSAAATSWFSLPLCSAKEKDAVAPLLLLVAAVHAVLEHASPNVCAHLADALTQIDGDAYSALRSTATGRSTAESSWIRLKSLVPEPMQEVFHGLLSRVSVISATQPPQPFALTSASCPFGVATEAAAIIVCLRAYLDEQGQPILLPDDRDAAQLALPAPAVDFIRVLLNMSFFSFPLTDTVHSSKRSSLMAASVDDAGALKRNSLVPLNAKLASAAVAPSTLLDGSADSSGKRASMTGAPVKRGSAAAGSTPPIVAFLASSMCRSSQGMFADAAGGSIRCVSPPLCGSVLVARDIQQHRAQGREPRPASCKSDAGAHSSCGLSFLFEPETLSRHPPRPARCL